MSDSSVKELVVVLHMRRDDLKKEVASAEEELAYLRGEFTRRERQINAKVDLLEKELQYVEGLLALRDGAKEGPDEKSSSEEAPKRRIQDVVFDILKNEGRGLHYTEIVGRVSSRGVLLPVSNPGAALVSRLSRDKRFARPESRGVYALREWNPQAADVGARRRRSKRQSRGRGTQRKA